MKNKKRPINITFFGDSICNGDGVAELAVDGGVSGDLSHKPRGVLDQLVVLRGDLLLKVHVDGEVLLLPLDQVGNQRVDGLVGNCTY